MTTDIPTFDMSSFIAGQEDESTCLAMAEYMAQTGIMVIKDPRVSIDDNQDFTKLMQSYYSQPVEELMKDARPEAHYQVGVTPEHVECAKCAKDPKCLAEIDAMPEDRRPHRPTTADPKWRYFHRIGPRPADSTFPEQNLEPVQPAAFPDWNPTMDAWGAKLLTALETASEMLALGLQLERSDLRDLLHCGPHLLAPTGSDLSRYSAQGNIFAGYHTDLNFLTIHGKSNFPGLYVWLRDGSKMAVKVPPGCLIIQAGQQMEYVTGGHIKAGFHEVVVDAACSARAQEVKAEGGCLWRISSTMFGTVNSDMTLTPFGRFKNLPGAEVDYPPITAGQQVLNELKSIGMAEETA